jgi:hypothetical protein
MALSVDLRECFFQRAGGRHRCGEKSGVAGGGRRDLVKREILTEGRMGRYERFGQFLEKHR